MYTMQTHSWLGIRNEPMLLLLFHSSPVSYLVCVLLKNKYAWGSIVCYGVVIVGKLKAVKKKWQNTPEYNRSKSQCVGLLVL